jgi:hypothetical protein
MSGVCVAGNCLYGPDLGGHAWVYLNWALGALAAAGTVTWLEPVDPATPLPEVQRLLRALEARLEPFDLAGSISLCSWSQDHDLDPSVAALARPFEDACAGGTLIDLVYDLPARVVRRFARSGLVNIDPGLLESWMRTDAIRVAEHGAYFTIGARTFDDTRDWVPTRPCVALTEWPVTEAAAGGAFTTVTGWYGNEWIELDDGSPARNDKRAGYLPFLDLPSRTAQPVELALDLDDDPEREADLLASKGWRVAVARDVAGTPASFRDYVGASLGELGCCKPAYARWRTGWISDRTVCYLASGKPAVVQDTGPNPLLDEAGGVLRFTTVDEAAAALEKCAGDYDSYCRDARATAEDLFDARDVVGAVLEHLA